MKALGNLISDRGLTRPTPIYLLSEAENRIFTKREDFIPFSFGGNKARKAILFFKEIDSKGADCVVTYGSSSSNHCRVVANMAAARGLPCYIISPEEASEPTYNSFHMQMFGAKIETVPVNKVHDTIEARLYKLRKSGMNPYFIPGGGHGNIGTQAYVECYSEILEYERCNGIGFDYIFFASGTGTTHAGLVCGQLLNGVGREIIGISIARKKPRGRNVVIDSIKEYFGSKSVSIPDSKIEEATIFIDSYTGDGYGVNNDSINRTITDVMTRYGLPLDTTYTGKAFYGMLSEISVRNLKGKTILFIHTGGTPLYFDTLRQMSV